MEAVRFETVRYRPPDPLVVGPGRVRPAGLHQSSPATTPRLKRTTSRRYSSRGKPRGFVAWMRPEGASLADANGQIPAGGIRHLAAADAVLPWVSHLAKRVAGL